MWWYFILNSFGKYEVVNEVSVRFVCPVNNLLTGTRVKLLGRGDENNSAIIISASRSQQEMEFLLPRDCQQNTQRALAPTLVADQERSASDGSEWDPSDTDSASSCNDSDTEEDTKTIQTNKRFYTKSSKVLKPLNRIDPIVPNVIPAPLPVPVPSSYNNNDTVIEENDYAKRLVRLINDLTKKIQSPANPYTLPSVSENHVQPDSTVPCNEDNSSGKVRKINVKKEKKLKQENEKNYGENSKTNEDEWIPIGSGTTLIHKDEYRKIKWSSYTKATRTLLLAAFPRRILATHSMTGKKSPAFPDKPAKLCLDQRITEDIILEITERFKVKKNLVRTIITTKCADECKMMKLQHTKTKTPSKSKKNVKESEVCDSKCKLDIVS